MNRFPSTAMQATDVLTDKLIGRWPYDTAVDHQMFKIADLCLFLQHAHGGAFDVKAAHGIPFCHIRLRSTIIFRLPELLVKYRTVIPKICNGISDNTQAAITEKIDFDQAALFCGIFFPLNNRNTFGGKFNRNIIVYGLRGDHHTTRMNRNVAWNTNDVPGCANNFWPGSWKIKFRKLGQLFKLLKKIFFRVIRSPEPWKTFGDTADLSFGKPEDLGHLPYRHTRPKSDVITDQRDVTFILVQYGLQNLVPFIPGKIDIDIR